MSPSGARVYAGLNLGATRDLSAPVIVWQDVTGRSAASRTMRRTRRGKSFPSHHRLRRRTLMHSSNGRIVPGGPFGRRKSSTRSADSRSLTRLLITDFETFRRVAAAVTLPDFTTLINVRISSRRQVHRSLLANTRCVWHVFTSCRETLRRLDGHRRVLRSVLAARHGRAEFRRVVTHPCSNALAPSASDRA